MAEQLMMLVNSRIRTIEFNARTARKEELWQTMAIFSYNPEKPYREEPDLYLKYWGKEECAPGHASGPGVRDHYKVHFVHGGTGIVRVGEHEYALKAGQGFLIYPHVVTYYEADGRQPWTYSWIGFQGSEAAAVMARTGLTPEEPVFPMDLRVMPGFYEQLAEAAASKGSAGLKLQSLLYQFLSALVEAAPADASEAASSRKQDAYVHRGMDFIHTHYGEDISVGQLASILGLDRKYLSAIFKEAVGVPPQRYLLRYRMDKASELLADGRYTIGEVARSVGYRDALLFSRMFKKEKGVSPQQYKDGPGASRPYPNRNRSDINP